MEKKDILEGLIPEAKKYCEMHPEILDIMQLDSDEEKQNKLKTLRNEFARAIVISTYISEKSKMEGLKNVKGSIGQKVIIESLAKEEMDKNLSGLSVEELNELNAQMDTQISNSSSKIEKLEEEYKRKLILIILSKKKLLEEQKAKEEELKLKIKQLDKRDDNGIDI